MALKPKGIKDIRKLYRQKRLNNGREKKCSGNCGCAGCRKKN